MKWDELKNKKMTMFGTMPTTVKDQFELMIELPEQKQIILTKPKVGAAVKFLEEALGSKFEVVVGDKSVTVTQVE